MPIFTARLNKNNNKSLTMINLFIDVLFFFSRFDVSVRVCVCVYMYKDCLLKMTQEEIFFVAHELKKEVNE